MFSPRIEQFLNCQRTMLVASLPAIALVMTDGVFAAAQDAGFAPIPAVRPPVPQSLTPQPLVPQPPVPQPMTLQGGEAQPVVPPALSMTDLLPTQQQVPPASGLTVRQGVLSPATNRDGISPPPGTLGTTYQRRSRLVPDDKHPRTAIVDLWNVPESADINARGLKPRWYQDHWRLESETPLIPGIPHIYGIQVTKTIDGQKSIDVKWVRLIMGRIVDLDF